MGAYYQQVCQLLVRTSVTSRLLPQMRKGVLGSNSIDFCSPAKKITFSGLLENSFVGKKVKVLTSKQNATKPNSECRGFPQKDTRDIGVRPDLEVNPCTRRARRAFRPAFLGPSAVVTLSRLEPQARSMRAVEMAIVPQTSAGYLPIWWVKMMYPKSILPFLPHSQGTK